MADITIVNGVYKPTYNWGATTGSRFGVTEGELGTAFAQELLMSLCQFERPRP